MTRRGNNEGTITKRGEKYRVQLMVNGVRHSATFDTKREAKDWMANMLKTYRHFKGAPTMPLTEYFQRYYEMRKPDLALNTQYSWERCFRLYIKPYFKDIPMSKVTADVLQDFYNKISVRGTRTVQVVHGILRTMFKYAVRSGTLPFNPSDGVIAPRKRKVQVNTWTADQVRQFLESVKGHHNEHLFALAFYTGARVSELAALMWDDIDWEHNVIRIRRQVIEKRGGGYEFVEPKTIASARSIEMSDGIRARLEDQEERCEKIFGRVVRGNDVVFPSVTGKMQQRNDLWFAFRKATEEAGLPPLRFHDIRHTAASLMLSRGVPITVVSYRLGHSAPSITMSIYAHFIPGTQEIASSVMDELVK